MEKNEADSISGFVILEDEYTAPCVDSNVQEFLRVFEIEEYYNDVNVLRDAPPPLDWVPPKVAEEGEVSPNYKFNDLINTGIADGNNTFSQNNKANKVFSNFRKVIKKKRKK
jgi:hypothetical protein